MKKNPHVTELIKNESRWSKEFEALRNIILETGLSEEFKWEQPTYALGDANICLIHGFKKFCAILFFKGSLMEDPRDILVQQTENVQVGRQIRFTNLAEIEDMKSTIKQYVEEAIRVEKSGIKAEYKQTKDYKVPEELQEMFEEMPAFKEAFEKLTPGRQRGYLLFFAAAKQSDTRKSRIEKNIDKIMDGYGLMDDYKLSNKKI